MKLFHHKYIPPSLEEYAFADRDICDRSEMYEPSPEELEMIEKAKISKVSPQKAPTVEGTVKCIIDTDIGTDFDDTLALLYALNLDNLEILGITTNYGPSQLRSFIVHKIVDSYHKNHPEKNPIPVISGANFQIGTHHEIFINGNEGKPFLTEEQIEDFLDEKKWESNSQTDAAEFICKTINSQPPKTVKLISIGIMTNIALSFKLHPEIIDKINEIVVMGGGSFITQQKKPFISNFSENPSDWEKDVKNFTENLPKNDQSVLKFISEGNPIHLFPNHNFSADTMAAIYSIKSNLRIKILCHSVTSRFWLKGRPIQYLHDRAKDARKCANFDDIDEIEAAGLIMEEWFKLRLGQNGQCPHDPLTVHEAAFGSEQSPVYYVRGTLILHKWAAYSTFVPNEDGEHFLGVYVNNKDVRHFIDFLGKKITNNYEKEKS